MNLNPFIDAITSGKWIVLAALVVGALVATAKQGWLGAWIAKKLPPAAIPYVSVVLGALGMAATEVTQGKPLAQALRDGVLSGVLAVFGHETLVESMRGGKEIVPQKSSSPPEKPSSPEPKTPEAA